MPSLFFTKKEEDSRMFNVRLGKRFRYLSALWRDFAITYI